MSDPSIDQSDETRAPRSADTWLALLMAACYLVMGLEALQQGLADRGDPGSLATGVILVPGCLVCSWLIWKGSCSRCTPVMLILSVFVFAMSVQDVIRWHQGTRSASWGVMGLIVASALIFAVIHEARTPKRGER